MQDLKLNKVICPCCNNLVTSLREKRNEDTREPVLACEDCWDNHDRLWYYLDKRKYIPYYKGIKLGQKVWCNLGFERDMWFKGVVNKITIVNTLYGPIYLYECFTEDLDIDNLKIFVTLETVDEEDIRYRHVTDIDALPVDLEYATEEIRLHTKLCDNCYVDEL